MKCEVKGCKNYWVKKGGNIRYFVFPKNKDLREKWIQACGKKPKKSKDKIVICACHFTDDDWRLQDKLLDVPINKRRLKSDAIPTKNLPKMEECPSARKKRAHERARKRIVEEAIRSSFGPKRMKIQHDENPTHQQQYEQREQHEQQKHHKQKQEHEQLKETESRNFDKMPVLGTSTQTEIDFKCSNQLKIMQLERQNRELKKRNRQLHNENIQHLRVMNNLNNVFTTGQIKKLLNPEKRITWSVNDICSAICLRSEEPRAYKYLYNKKFPLPAPGTLEKWTSKINMKPGILSTVLNLMEQSPFVGNDRLCTLVFGEMKIRHKFDYDKASDLTISPTNSVQVVLARGLMKQWKQPVFYDYNCKMSVAILNSIIEKLYEKDYVVVSITFDMEPGNDGLWEELNITKENVWFRHPSNASNKIFVFADVVHMIKLLRIYFLDLGFNFRNAEINVDPIKEVMAATSVSNLKITHKITDMHLNVRRISRQKYATQLFSSSVSNAIRQCINIGKCEIEYALECADFIEIVSNWFDVFNMANSCENMTALALAEQKLIIENMSEMISSMRVIGEEDMLPFQEGILISNAAVLELHNYITRKYNLNYGLAYRLNQDTIEQFFSAIRDNDGSREHLSLIEFKNRLKSYLVGISYNNEIFNYKDCNNDNENDPIETVEIKGLLENNDIEKEVANVFKQYNDEDNPLDTWLVFNKKTF